MRLDALIDRLVAGDGPALARCLTLVDSSKHAGIVRRRIGALTGRTRVIGFTGAPGVGKSTLIDAYIAELRRADHSVGVLAVDPSSPLTGGALLGDRIRMGRHSADPGVFIRSVAARGHLGGLTESIHWQIEVMDAAKRETVIVETVGTGQSEVEVAEIADICIVVSAPSLGDDIQAIKAGILEIADILVVNKADLPLAGLAVRQLHSMLKLRDETGRDVPVLMTTATEEQGVAELHAAVERILQRRSDEKTSRRKRRLRRLIAQSAADAARRHVLGTVSPQLIEALIEAVAAGEITIEAAAQRALSQSLKA